MTTLPGECGMTWALEDPNAEDRRFGRTHECWMPLNHDNDHGCRCGATQPR